MAIATNVVFKIPQEPCPLTTLESDEESFVVLGQSIPDASTELYPEPIGLSVIAEAKRLINFELEAIDQAKNNDEKKGCLESNKDVFKLSSSTMDTSENFPMMANINRGVELSSVISIASFTPDMSSEEVQKKIAHIIDENIRLKDTVLQNNLSLKSQYERIVAWQEDVQKVHQAHKDKLLEAKAFIETLKREKDSLKRELTKDIEFGDSQASQIEELKKRLDEKDKQRYDYSIKESQLKDQEKKISNLQLQLNNMSIEKKQVEEQKNIVCKLQAHLNDIIEERNSGNKQIEELRAEISIKSQREESLHMTITSLKSQMEASAEEVNTLRTQLGETQNALTRMEATRSRAYSQIRELTDELSEVRSQLESLQSQTQERSRDSELDHEEMSVLKMQMDVYKTDFEEERRAREVMKASHDVPPC
ncbi:myosin-9-like isoform X2 [Diabrotica virgifera virgifera]|uniref:NF-kappa-B essential modulator NEMO CC2-LZ domain-containing protein n=1 Tax=Diabrotica virgifera virgifera TaxID=50390 RepID=A0ABM5KPH6_DIAVI|nr:myosin-9-like isoform X2 [Diabrotica virgifera virgifera]